MVHELTTVTIGHGKTVHFSRNTRYTVCGVQAYNTSPQRESSQEANCKKCVSMRNAYLEREAKENNG